MLTTPEYTIEWAFVTGSSANETIKEFFTDSNIVQLLRKLARVHMRYTDEDLALWKDDPEEFIDEDLR